MRQSTKTIDNVVDDLEKILEKKNAAYVTFRDANGEKKKIFIRNFA